MISSPQPMRMAIPGGFAARIRASIDHRIGCAAGRTVMSPEDDRSARPISFAAPRCRSAAKPCRIATPYELALSRLGHPAAQWQEDRHGDILRAEPPPVRYPRRILGHCFQHHRSLGSIVTGVRSSGAQLSWPRESLMRRPAGNHQTLAAKSGRR